VILIISLRWFLVVALLPFAAFGLIVGGFAADDGVALLSSVFGFERW